MLSTNAELWLGSFDRLPDDDKRQLASEILRRTTNADLPSLTNEELVMNAEELFQELDRRESEG